MNCVHCFWLVEWNMFVCVKVCMWMMMDVLKVTHPLGVSAWRALVHWKRRQPFCLPLTIIWHSPNDSPVTEHSSRFTYMGNGRKGVCACICVCLVVVVGGGAGWTVITHCGILRLTEQHTAVKVIVITHTSLTGSVWWQQELFFFLFGHTVSVWEKNCRCVYILCMPVCICDSSDTSCL